MPVKYRKNSGQQVEGEIYLHILKISLAEVSHLINLTGPSHSRKPKIYAGKLYENSRENNDFENDRSWIE